MAERVSNPASINLLDLTCCFHRKMLSITVYNESFSYTFYVLGYQVEKQQYNLTVVTRIMSVNNTNLFMTMVNIDPRDGKAVPVADIVFFTNKTTLADHYKLLGKVLNEIRKNDNTSWVRNKVRIELNELAKTVERDLVDYNVEGAGIAFVIDNDCSYLCNITCGSGFAILCLAGGILGGPLVGAICGVSTSVGCTAICGEVCNEPVGWEDLTCAGACNLFFVTPVCSKFGVAAPICEKFMANIGICTLICDQIGYLFGG